MPQIEPGMVLAGRYRILSSVGKGGMGQVYAGEEESLGIRRLVAIKVLPPQMMLDESLMARFREEIRIAAQLDHPHIVPIYSLGEHQGVYFYVMKLLDGQTAFQRLRQSGPFTEPDLRKMAAPIARALHYAHSKGVIHRDIKSNNIHLGADGHPTLMDFGVARGHESAELTSPGQIIGTAECMAPEQWVGHAEPRSDIYGLGVVLYELAAGKLPCDSRQTYELMKFHMEVTPPRLRIAAPGMSAELEAIVLKCLAKEPNDRYPHALALAEALESPYRAPDAAPDAPPPAVEPAAFTGDRSPTAMETARTMLTPGAAVELVRVDKRLWRKCVTADEAYAGGELAEALRLMKRAAKAYPDSREVKERVEKFSKMKALTDQIMARGDAAMAAAKLKQAIAEYENVLRCMPLPAAAAKLVRARAQAEQADELLYRAQQAKRDGRPGEALKLAARAFRMHQEIDPPHDGGPRSGRHKRRPKKKRAPIVTGGRVALLLFVALLVAAVDGARPLLLRLADAAYDANTDQSLFLAEFGAERYYAALARLPSPPPRVADRLRTINRRAKAYYTARANEAVQSGALGAAIKYLEKALARDPGDGKLVDALQLYQAKYAVQQSLATKPGESE
jgi:tetratricopeptide (TPR) repeat protein